MVVSELRGEKIDIIPYNEEPARFVAKALSPARVREVLVDDETKEATVIVPDDQLSLAIGRDGQNARLAARLTGWKVDITSETEFAQQEEDIEYEGEEAADGRCKAVMTTGRRCPNAALQGSQFCGLPQHQALAKFHTNQVAVLAPLSDEEVATIANGDAGDAEIKALVDRAESQFDESAEGGEAEERAAEAEESAAEQAEEEAPEAEEPGAETEEEEPDEEPTPEEGGEEPAPEEEPAAEPEPEEQAADQPASADGGEPEAEPEHEQEQETPAPSAATNTAAGSREEQTSE